MKKAKKFKTDEEVLAQANELARVFYRALGYEVRKGYRFDRATHPQEQLMWRLTKIAFEELVATDLDDTLSAVGD